MEFSYRLIKVSFIWSLFVVLVLCSCSYDEYVENDLTTENPIDCDKASSDETYISLDHGFCFSYSSEFEIKQYQTREERLFTLTILLKEDLESGAGELPEISIGIYENENRVSVTEWLENHQDQESFPFYLDPQNIENNILYFDSTKENPIYMTNFSTSRHIVPEANYALFLDDKNNAIFEISHIDIQSARMSRTYWQLINSFRFITE